MPKIPNIEKFKGENKQSFAQWIAKFEAQCSALDISSADDKKKWRDMLMVTTDGDAFSTIITEISRLNTITYVALKDIMQTKYTGDNYKRYLETKLHALKFQKGTNITEFLHELRNTIREFYELTDANAVDKIGMNHVVSQVDDSFKNDIRILQLAGNTRLENLLELLSTKMNSESYNFLATASATSTMMPPRRQQADHHFERLENNRIDRLENLVEKLANQVSTLATSPVGKNHYTRDLTCEHCHKRGHTKSKCFKLMSCNKCSKTGPIAKFCKEVENRQSPSCASETEHINSSKTETESTPLPNAPRIILPIFISNQKLEFLYDPGSMFTMIPRSTYEKLSEKTALMSSQPLWYRRFESKIQN